MPPNCLKCVSNILQIMIISNIMFIYRWFKVQILYNHFWSTFELPYALDCCVTFVKQKYCKSGITLVTGEGTRKHCVPYQNIVLKHLWSEFTDNCIYLTCNILQLSFTFIYPYLVFLFTYTVISNIYHKEVENKGYHKTRDVSIYTSLADLVKKIQNVQSTWTNCSCESSVLVNCISMYNQTYRLTFTSSLTSFLNYLYLNNSLT
jgi:hypothetical protein